MTLLMGANLVDGEEATTLSSEYVQASCLVTSGTESMSFDAGESTHASTFFRSRKHTVDGGTEQKQCHQLALNDCPMPAVMCRPRVDPDSESMEQVRDFV